MAASAGMRVAVKRVRVAEARVVEAMVAVPAGMRVAVGKVRVAEVRVVVQIVCRVCLCLHVCRAVVTVPQWRPRPSLSLSQPHRHTRTGYELSAAAQTALEMLEFEARLAKVAPVRDGMAVFEARLVEMRLEPPLRA